jgi:hypothetical protein
MTHSRRHLLEADWTRRFIALVLSLTIFFPSVALAGPYTSNAYGSIELSTPDYLGHNGTRWIGPTAGKELQHGSVELVAVGIQPGNNEKPASAEQGKPGAPGVPPTPDEQATQAILQVLGNDRSLPALTSALNQLNEQIARGNQSAVAAAQWVQQLINNQGGQQMQPGLQGGAPGQQGGLPGQQGQPPGQQVGQVEVEIAQGTFVQGQLLPAQPNFIPGKPLEVGKVVLVQIGGQIVQGLVGPNGDITPVPGQQVGQPGPLGGQLVWVLIAPGTFVQGQLVPGQPNLQQGQVVQVQIGGQVVQGTVGANGEIIPVPGQQGLPPGPVMPGGGILPIQPGAQQVLTPAQEVQWKVVQELAADLADPAKTVKVIAELVKETKSGNPYARQLLSIFILAGNEQGMAVWEKAQTNDLRSLITDISRLPKEQQRALKLQAIKALIDIGKETGSVDSFALSLVLADAISKKDKELAAQITTYFRGVFDPEEVEFDKLTIKEQSNLVERTQIVMQGLFEAIKSGTPGSAELVVLYIFGARSKTNRYLASTADAGMPGIGGYFKQHITEFAELAKQGNKDALLIVAAVASGVGDGNTRVDARSAQAVLLEIAKASPKERVDVMKALTAEILVRIGDRKYGLETLGKVAALDADNIPQDVRDVLRDGLNTTAHERAVVGMLAIVEYWNDGDIWAIRQKVSPALVAALAANLSRIKPETGFKLMASMRAEIGIGTFEHRINAVRAMGVLGARFATADDTDDIAALLNFGGPKGLSQLNFTPNTGDMNKDFQIGKENERAFQKAAGEALLAIAEGSKNPDVQSVAFLAFMSRDFGLDFAKDDRIVERVSGQTYRVVYVGIRQRLLDLQKNNPNNTIISGGVARLAYGMGKPSIAATFRYMGATINDTNLARLVNDAVQNYGANEVQLVVRRIALFNALRQDLRSQFSGSDAQLEEGQSLSLAGRVITKEVFNALPAEWQEAISGRAGKIPDGQSIDLTGMSITVATFNTFPPELRKRIRGTEEPMLLREGAEGKSTQFPSHLLKGVTIDADTFNSLPEETRYRLIREYYLSNGMQFVPDLQYARLTAKLFNSISESNLRKVLSDSVADMKPGTYIDLKGRSIDAATFNKLPEKVKIALTGSSRNLPEGWVLKDLSGLSIDAKVFNDLNKQNRTSLSGLIVNVDPGLALALMANKGIEAKDSAYHFLIDQSTTVAGNSRFNQQILDLQVKLESELALARKELKDLEKAEVDHLDKLTKELEHGKFYRATHSGQLTGEKYDENQVKNLAMVEQMKQQVREKSVEVHQKILRLQPIYLAQEVSRYWDLMQLGRTEEADTLAMQILTKFGPTVREVSPETWRALFNVGPDSVWARMHAAGKAQFKEMPYIGSRELSERRIKALDLLKQLHLPAESFLELRSKELLKLYLDQYPRFSREFLEGKARSDAWNELKKKPALADSVIVRQYALSIIDEDPSIKVLREKLSVISDNLNMLNILANAQGTRTDVLIKEAKARGKLIKKVLDSVDEPTLKKAREYRDLLEQSIQTVKDEASRQELQNRLDAIKYLLNYLDKSAPNYFNPQTRREIEERVEVLTAALEFANRFANSHAEYDYVKKKLEELNAERSRRGRARIELADLNLKLVAFGDMPNGTVIFGLAPDRAKELQALQGQLKLMKGPNGWYRLNELQEVIAKPEFEADTFKNYMKRDGAVLAVAVAVMVAVAFVVTEVATLGGATPFWAGLAAAAISSTAFYVAEQSMKEVQYRHGIRSDRSNLGAWWDGDLKEGPDGTKRPMGFWEDVALPAGQDIVVMTVLSLAAGALGSKLADAFAARVWNTVEIAVPKATWLPKTGQFVKNLTNKDFVMNALRQKSVYELSKNLLIQAVEGEILMGAVMPAQQEALASLQKDTGADMAMANHVLSQITFVIISAGKRGLQLRTMPRARSLQGKPLGPDEAHFRLKFQAESAAEEGAFRRDALLRGSRIRETENGFMEITKEGLRLSFTREAVEPVAKESAPSSAPTTPPASSAVPERPAAALETVVPKMSPRVEIESLNRMGFPSGTVSGDTYHDIGMYRGKPFGEVIQNLIGIVTSGTLTGSSRKGAQVSQNAGPTNWQESAITIRIEATPRELARQKGSRLILDTESGLQEKLPGVHGGLVFQQRTNWYMTGGEAEAPINLRGKRLKVIVNGETAAEMNARLAEVKEALKLENVKRQKEGLEPLDIEVKSVLDFLVQERIPELASFLPESEGKVFLESIRDSLVEHPDLRLRVLKEIGERTSKMTPEEFKALATEGAPEALDWVVKRLEQSGDAYGKNRASLVDEYFNSLSYAELFVTADALARNQAEAIAWEKQNPGKKWALHRSVVLSEINRVIDAALDAPPVLRSEQRPAELLRARYGQDSPAAAAVDMAIKALGAQVEGVAGSYARGDARAGSWEVEVDGKVRKLTLSEAQALDKVPSLPPEILQELPLETQALHALKQQVEQQRQTKKLDGLPSDLDIIVSDKVSSVELHKLKQAVYDETGILIEWVKPRNEAHAAASKVDAPSNLAQTPAGAAPEITAGAIVDKAAAAGNAHPETVVSKQVESSLLAGMLRLSPLELNRFIAEQKARLDQLTKEESQAGVYARLQRLVSGQAAQSYAERHLLMRELTQAIGILNVAKEILANPEIQRLMAARVPLEASHKTLEVLKDKLGPKDTLLRDAIQKNPKDKSLRAQLDVNFQRFMRAITQQNKLAEQLEANTAALKQTLRVYEIAFSAESGMLPPTLEGAPIRIEGYRDVPIHIKGTNIAEYKVREVLETLKKIEELTGFKPRELVFYANDLLDPSQGRASFERGWINDPVMPDTTGYRVRVNFGQEWNKGQIAMDVGTHEVGHVIRFMVDPLLSQAVKAQIANQYRLDTEAHRGRLEKIAIDIGTPIDQAMLNALYSGREFSPGRNAAVGEVQAAYYMNPNELAAEFFKFWIHSKLARGKLSYAELVERASLGDPARAKVMMAYEGSYKLYAKEIFNKLAEFRGRHVAATEQRIFDLLQRVDPTRTGLLQANYNQLAFRVMAARQGIDVGAPPGMLRRLLSSLGLWIAPNAKVRAEIAMASAAASTASRGRTGTTPSASPSATPGKQHPAAPGETSVVGTKGPLITDSQIRVAREVVAKSGLPLVIVMGRILPFKKETDSEKAARTLGYLIIRPTVTAAPLGTAGNGATTPPTQTQKQSSSNGTLSPPSTVAVLPAPSTTAGAVQSGAAISSGAIGYLKICFRRTAKGIEIDRKSHVHYTDSQGKPQDEYLKSRSPIAKSNPPVRITDPSSGVEVATITMTPKGGGNQQIEVTVKVPNEGTFTRLCTVCPAAVSGN